MPRTEKMRIRDHYTDALNAVADRHGEEHCGYWSSGKVYVPGLSPTTKLPFLSDGLL